MKAPHQHFARNLEPRARDLVTAALVLLFAGLPAAADESVTVVS